MNICSGVGLGPLVESMPRCIEAVLARGAQHPIKTLYVGVSFILADTCMCFIGINC